MQIFRHLIASFTTGVLLTGLALNFNACSQNNPLSSQPEQQVSNSGLKILKFGDESHKLNKSIQATQFVTQANGGILELSHGSQSQTFVYANENDAPYPIYRVGVSDPENNTVVVGQLAFASSAIALHPTNGLVYYVAKAKTDGIAKVATWDPASNTNTILPNGSSFKPSHKLAFAPDGALYGMDAHSTSGDELFTIDTATGEWHLVREYTTDLGNDGDFAFSPDGILYNANEATQELQIIDLNSDNVTLVGNTGLLKLSGLAFDHKGQLYLSTDSEKLYQVNLSNAAPTYLGAPDLGDLDDMAAFIASGEFSFAQVSLQILPGALSADVEISLSLDTNEIIGGCAVTFEPHGTTFSQPAILNIEAHGVDFTGVDPNSVDIYYDNQETGQWELMQRDDVIIDVNAGTIQVINALLPHFSRYAIGAE